MDAMSCGSDKLPLDDELEVNMVQSRNAVKLDK